MPAPALDTPYAALVSRTCPLPEYPRPQLQRADSSWLNLNGIWQVAFTAGELPTADAVDPPPPDGDILVPFAPETRLSGVGRTLLPGELLWYSRGFDPADLPAFSPAGRLLLHFGAVDQRCRVYVNGRLAGQNDGGYFAFTLDITDKTAVGRNTLQVVVSDPSDTGQGARGKQRLTHGKIWYSPTSGIWQTVWLEAVPAVYVEDVKLTPDAARRTIRFDVAFSAEPTAGVTAFSVHPYDDPGTAVEAVCTPLTAPEPCHRQFDVHLPGGRLWSPESPFLYGYRLTAGSDTIQGYFALRDVGIGTAADGVPRLLLNGEPYVQVGVLDQGYWSDGMYTPPTDAAMQDDIKAMKALGFNMLRKHSKIEPLRWYYHCDRLGMLVWQDMVNGGGPYRFPIIGLLPFLNIHLNDTRRCGRFGRQDDASRALFEQELARTVRQLRSIPSICLWVPFNEGWGQFEAARIAALVRRLDPTRPVDHASGWHDQGAGDLKSRHVYFKKIRQRKDRHGRPYALTEFGGFAYAVPGHTAAANEYGYKPYRTLEAYQEGVLNLLEQIAAHRPRILAATVYTQLSDVQDEINGLLTYDRAVSKWPAGSEAAERLKRVNTALRTIEKFAD